MIADAPTGEVDGRGLLTPGHRMEVRMSLERVLVIVILIIVVIWLAQVLL